jgi:hypothetical protein
MLIVAVFVCALTFWFCSYVIGRNPHESRLVLVGVMSLVELAAPARRPALPTHARGGKGELRRSQVMRIVGLPNKRNTWDTPLAHGTGRFELRSEFIGDRCGPW